MDPIIGGALIGGAASLLGGIMGRKSQKEQLSKSEELQRDFAQHGIQWRVEDAKRAGLHPLFALGASTSGPTIPVMDDPLARSVSEAGQYVGRAVGATESSSQREERLLRTEALRLQLAKDYALASAAGALAAKTKQEAMVSPAIDLTGSGSEFQTAAYMPRGRIEERALVEPAESKVKSFWTTFNVGGADNFHMDLLQSDEGPAESVEDTPLWLWPAVIEHNEAKYGSFWKQRLIARFPIVRDINAAARSGARTLREYRSGKLGSGAEGAGRATGRLLMDWLK